MTTMRTHFTFRVDTWTPDSESIVEHIARVEAYQVALATYRAACRRWPGTPITLLQGARVIEDSGLAHSLSSRGTFLGRVSRRMTLIAAAPCSCQSARQSSRKRRASLLRAPFGLPTP
jgi:hypothetical protein